MQQILVAVRALSLKERQELTEALDQEALDQEALGPPARPNRNLVLAVRGRYARVPTSSDAFMARKREELASEN